MAPSTSPHVVIVGGGFAGVTAARALARRPVRVTLVDRQNHHLFQPLLYQVASAALSPADIAAPLRAIFRKAENVWVIMAEAGKIDLASRRVVLGQGEIEYDALILATGATHSYFGHDDWEERAPGLKTLEDALEIRRRILTAFEDAERTADEAERRALLTFVVIGGGATGVELAGALGEISRQTIAHDFRRIDPTTAHIVLLEGGPRILPVFSESLSRYAEQSLRRIGVEVRTGALVTRITGDAVWIGGEQIHCRTVLWAAGVAGSALARSLGVPLDRAGRVPVEVDLSIPGHPEAFVVGDLAAFVHQTGQPLPGVAPVAIQQGRAAAENVWRRVSGGSTAPFRYRDKGSMATIGRGAAVAMIGRFGFSGLLAWLAWVFLHIMYLVGFRNRLSALFQWAWEHFTYQRSARLIIGSRAAVPNERGRDPS